MGTTLRLVVKAPSSTLPSPTSSWCRFTLDLQYVGPPQDAPWQEIAGAHWVSHNAGFDSAVFQAARNRKLISATPPSRWSCSADLSAFVGIGRKLSEAVKNSFGVTLDKSIRNRAGNRVWPSGFNQNAGRFQEILLSGCAWVLRALDEVARLLAAGGARVRRYRADAFTLGD